ncbi:MAG: hypothetical protein ACLFMM_02555 [Methanohalobium sp.]|uniref:hypothetical protein n=1 Tax=Methanohalobium sp. TaxID=2837493 RepID=UPI003978D71E
MSNTTKQKVYGVDFSGAENACQKIWISEGTINGDDLLINNCWQISDFLDDKQKKDRNSCHNILKDFIANNSDAIFGLDVPFGVPGSLTGNNNWKSFIRKFPSQYKTPEDFRDSCRKKTRYKELKRFTDIDKKAPFCVYNLRLYKQTFYCIRDIINPLIEGNYVSILPMQYPEMEKSWLIEICPACTLKQEKLYNPYKGKTKKEHVSRAGIVEYFSSIFKLSSKVKKLAIEDIEGDALDSVIALVATFRALNTLSDFKFLRDLPGIYKKEGYTFA